MDLIPFSISELSLETYLISITTRSRIIYWIIIVMILIGIAVLPFIYVDVSVQARGYFQSEIEKQVVNVPFQGKIIYTSIRNGAAVSKGDTLLIINSETIRAQHGALILTIKDNDSSINDLEVLTKLNSLENPPSQIRLVTQRYKAEFANLRNLYGRAI